MMNSPDDIKPGEHLSYFELTNIYTFIYLYNTGTYEKYKAILNVGTEYKKSVALKFSEYRRSYKDTLTKCYDLARLSSFIKVLIRRYNILMNNKTYAQMQDALEITQLRTDIYEVIKHTCYICKNIEEKYADTLPELIKEIKKGRLYL